MRAITSRLICLLAPLIDPTTVNAADAHAIEHTAARKAQIIAFASDVKSVSATPNQNADQRLDTVASDTRDLAMHDRSRHTVAFQADERIYAVHGAMRRWPQPAVTTIRYWMPAEPSTLNPDEAVCLANSYRPTGFLRFEAERNRLAHYPIMRKIACETGLPVPLFDAMIIHESRYRSDARSPKNAFGLTQLMPGTAQALGVDRYSLEGNLRGGARYLRQQLDRFGHYHLALAAYNAGPGRVRGGRIPAIAETQAYVSDVLWKWSQLTATAQPHISSQWRGTIAFSRQAEVQIF